MRRPSRRRYWPGRGTAPKNAKWECPYCMATYQEYCDAQACAHDCADIDPPRLVDDETAERLDEQFDEYEYSTAVEFLCDTIARRPDYPRCRTETPGEVLCSIWLRRGRENVYLGQDLDEDDIIPDDDNWRMPDTNDINQLRRWAHGEDPLPETRHEVHQRAA